ncbi:hypothetical protein L1987_33464 [Smallanthus sonchifolius]|uniref:Uncharacterized protein n=1 Tax=Smallanthus sonchifolius TaxID=185202 RepID=A0ACB9HR43_9ASTR|nr:hypothetical protein L1987_33464 [Smallanthus sonchifolius]
MDSLVIVGTFSIEGKKESAAVVKGDASTNKLPSPNVGAICSKLEFPIGTGFFRQECSQLTNFLLKTVNQKNKTPAMLDYDLNTNKMRLVEADSLDVD